MCHLSCKTTHCQVTDASWPQAGALAINCCACAPLFLLCRVAALSLFQVYSQPVFQLIEGHIRRARAGNDIPVIMQFGMRAVYVAVLTVVAILVPFVSYIMGLVGENSSCLKVPAADTSDAEGCSCACSVSCLGCSQHPSNACKHGGSTDVAAASQLWFTIPASSNTGSIGCQIPA